MSQLVIPSPNPTETEIKRAMAPYGFRNISRDAFLHFETRILLTDAAPRNVRVVEGRPIPFDAIAEVATDEVLNWAFLRCL